MTGSAPGVMVVERGDGDMVVDLFTTWAVPALCKVAEPGLRGDRHGVMAALNDLRLNLSTAECFAGREGEVEQRLASLITTFTHMVESAAETRPVRFDVLAGMHRLGTLSAEEFAAGVELRSVAQVLTEVGTVQAVDFSRPIVDGSSVWSMPTGGDALVTVTPMLRKAQRWAEWIKREGRTIRSRRGSGVQATVLAIVHRVVFENVPLLELDKELKVRKGTCAQVVKGALALHASLETPP